MIPRIVDKKLYPTPDNYQRSGESELKLTTAIAELQRFTRGLPEGVDPDSVVLRNWQALEVWCQYRLTELDVAQRQLAVFMQALQGRVSSGVGMTPQEVKDLFTKAGTGG